MRNLIRKILREAVGVPEGILEASEKLFTTVYNKLRTIDDSDIEDEYSFNYRKKLKILDLDITNISLEITFQETNQVKKVEFYSMSVHQRSSFSNEDKKLEAVIEPGLLRLNINLAGPEGTTKDEILEYFNSEKADITSSLAHELTHAYNHFKQKYISMKSLSRYVGISRTSFPFYAIQNFLHNIYFIHNIENLVRPVEVASLMRSGKINREGFYDFLLNNDTYKKLKQISNFSYEKLREDLKQESDNIRNFLINLRHPNVRQFKTDDQLVDELLRIVYINLTSRSLDTAKEMMTTNSIEQLLGFSGIKDEMFSNMVKKFTKFEDNIEGFYRYEERNMKYVAEEMMKKLSKLYSLIKTKKSSIKNWDLHQKINKSGEQIEIDLKYKR